MAATAKAGSFTLNSATGTQAITGVGFEPALVIFWAQTRASVSGAIELRRCFGAAASSSARWCSATSILLSPATQNQRFTASHCVQWTAASTGNAALAVDFVSMDEDGFTVDVETNGVSGIQVWYFAFGGADVAVGTFNTTTTAGASQAVTGTGFVPKALILSRGGYNTADAAINEGHFMIGLATAPSEQAVAGFYFEGNNPSPASAFQRTDRCMAMIDRYVYHADASLASFDADGFTLSWGLTRPTAAKCGYVAIGGDVEAKVFSLDAPAAISSASLTGLGFTPGSELFFTRGVPASSLVTNPVNFGIGAASGTDNCAAAFYVPHLSTSTTLPVTHNNSNRAIGTAGTSTQGTWSAQASMVSQDADGFTLNWYAVSGSPQVIGLAFATAAAQTIVFPVGRSSTTAVGSVTVTTEGSVTVSGLASTSALGDVSITAYDNGVAPLIDGLVITCAVGEVTGPANASIDLEGLESTAGIGTVVQRTVAGSTVSGFSVEASNPFGFRVFVVRPHFNLLPDFTPHDDNHDADPSQPTRWTNVLPP